MKKQKDGRYRAKVTIGVDGLGKTITKYVSGRTKRELEQAKADVREKYIAGIDEKAQTIMALDWIWQWYEAKRKPKQKTHTQRSNIGTINKYIVPHLQGKRLSAVSLYDLERIMDALAGRGRTLIGNVYSILKGAFDAASAHRVLQYNPMQGLDKPKVYSEKRRALTGAETKAVLKLIADNHRDALLLALLYYTGMRRGEILGLKWSDIDFDANLIHVCRDADLDSGREDALKTKSSARDIPLVDALKIILHKRRGIGYIFLSRSGGLWHSATYSRRWRTIAEDLYKACPQIDAVGGKSVLTAHYFRHNFASILYNKGVDPLTACRVLGHSDIRTTLSIYTHLANEQQKLSGDESVRAAFAN